MYMVTLVCDDPNGLITERVIGTATTKTKAMAMAKRAAGRGAEYDGRCGIRYNGPNGSAYAI
jgi:hypothetical protein